LRNAGARLPDLSAGVVDSVHPLDDSGARFALVMADSTKCVISGAMVVELRLRATRVVDEDTAIALTARARRLWLFDRAVRALSAAGRSTRDLTVRLRRFGGTQDEVAAVITELTELGLLNDAEYARTLATRRAASGTARGRIGQELRRKGVATSLASKAASEAAAESPLDEYEVALALGHRRMRSLAKLDPAVATRRLFAFLVRRGYSSRVVARVTRELVAG
jgi:regulatory protein